MVKALRESTFVDGKLTAGDAAREVKNNLELSRDDPRKNTLAQIVMTGLYRSEVFRNAVMPLRVSTPIFARYEPGMYYGVHIDDPIMGQGQPYRTDVSFTLFLADPASYDGGETTIVTPFGEQKAKLAAGDAVVYPSGTLHHVAAVTRGERLVALGWIQSMVRDPAKRELLYNLSRARDKLMASANNSDEHHWVDHSYINLVRMWSEL